MKAKLEVGDRIYELSHNNITRVYEVLRVTATTALATNSTKFRRDIVGDGHVIEHGKTNTWVSYTYQLESEELKLKLEWQRLSARLGGTEFKLLPVDAMRKIVAILDEHESTNK